ncbi:5903_t:CDS:10, partial [Cetraspora pellucida]
MINDIIVHCLEELALDGDIGCNLDRLWEFVQNFFDQRLRDRKVHSIESGSSTQPSKSSIQCLDDLYKSYFWSQFVNSKVLIFFLSNANTNDESTIDVRTDLTSENLNMKQGEILLDKHKIVKMTLQDVQINYGDNFRIKTIPEYQKRIIFGAVDTTRQITPIVYTILQYIARHRAIGATQADMAKDLQIDPRSFYHYVKTLINLKLIVKLPVVTKGIYTNLCILTKCASQNPAYLGKSVYLPTNNSNNSRSVQSSDYTYDPTDTISCGVSFNSELIKIKFTEILGKAKNQIMLANDLMVALFGVSTPTKKQRRWFNRTIGTLTHQGYIEKINVPKKDSNKQLDRCLRLITHYEKGKEPEMGKYSHKSTISTSDKGQSVVEDHKIGIYAELPLDYQVYQLIQGAGEYGIIAGAIKNAFGNMNHRVLTKILERLVKPTPPGLSRFIVKRASEFQGRERRYRYFSLDGYIKFATFNGIALDDDLQQLQENQSSSMYIHDPLWGVEFLLDDEEEKDTDFLQSQECRDRRKRKKEKLRMTQTDISQASQSSQAVPQEPPIKRKRGRPRKIVDDEKPAVPKGKSGRPKGSKDKKPRKPPRKKMRTIQNDDENELNNVHLEDVNMEFNDMPSSNVETTDAPNPLSLNGSDCMEFNDPPSSNVETTDAPNPLSLNGSDCMEFNDLPSSNVETTDAPNSLSLNGSDCMEFNDLSSSNVEMVDTQNSLPLNGSDCMELNNLPSFNVETTDAQNPLSLNGSDCMENLSTNTNNEYRTSRISKNVTRKRKKPVSNRKSEPETRKKFANSASITAALRQNIILQILEEHQVVELGTELIKLYQQALQKEPNSTSNHVIDKKTLQRTGLLMEEKSLLRTYNVKLPLLNGNYNTKILFLHSSLTSSSPIVKEYVAKMEDRAILVGRSHKQTKIEELDIEVEPLEQLQKRLAVEAAADESINLLSLPTSNNGHNEPESYEALMSNMSSTVDPTPVSSDTLETPDSTSVNSRVQTSNEMWWLHTARGYGWINAKMIRAKILHQYLITKIIDASPNDSCIEKNTRTFHTTILLRDLPLELYLKIIGQSIPSHRLTEYVRSGQSLSVSVIKLPSELRAELFSGNYKLRQNLKKLIDILVALKILKPIRKGFNERGDPVLEVENKESDYFDDELARWSPSTPTSCSPPQTLLAPAYQLMRHVPMIDFSVSGPDRPIIRDYMLDSVEDVTIYWNELQYVARQKMVETGNKSNNELSGDEEARKKSAQDDDSVDPLRFITLSRNWNAGYPLTAKQKKMLEHYVDRRKSKTPYEDEALCRQIAQECSLPFTRVRVYFKHIENSFEKKRKDSKTARQKERRRRVASKSKNLSGIVTSAEGEPSFKRRKRETMVHKVVRKTENSAQAVSGNNAGRKSLREKFKQKGLTDTGSIAEEENLPIIADEERFETQYETLSQRSRPKWSQHEDELVIHVYVILKVRSQKSRFLWGAITKVLPHKTNEICRRRLNVLIKNTATLERVNVLLSQWPRMYEAGLKNGHIVDEDESDMLNFDLPGHLDYFMKVLQHHTRQVYCIATKESPDPIIPLPCDIKTYERTFIENYVSTMRHQNLFYEDKLGGSSLRQKFSMLYSHPVTCRIFYNESVDDYEKLDISDNDINVQCIQALVK